MTDIERIRMRQQIVTLAVSVGELDEGIRKALFRRYKDRRYRAKKVAQNLQRVRAVEEELRQEFHPA